MQKKIIAKIALFAVLIIFQIILHPQNKSEFNLDTTPKVNMISITIGGDFIANGTFPAAIGE